MEEQTREAEYECDEEKLAGQLEGGAKHMIDQEASEGNIHKSKRIQKSCWCHSAGVGPIHAIRRRNQGHNAAMQASKASKHEWEKMNPITR